MLLLDARGAAGVRHSLPADDAADHGQGRRGHRLLPLRPPARAQRGRRRSRALRDRASSDFHAGTPSERARFPENLLTTQTHDAKRSADVRARLAALASMPEEWEQPCSAGGAHRALPQDGAPDDVERYFLFQTLVGAWPIELERVQEYMEKALREAKRNTNWIDQDHELGAGGQALLRGALLDDRGFLDDFEPFARRVAAAGERAVLGQVVLKLTAPGRPRLYQGDELPFSALVDPDNRRPVDWGWRQAMLRPADGRRAAGAADPQAVLDPAAADAAGAAAGAVRDRRLREEGVSLCRVYLYLQQSAFAAHCAGQVTTGSLAGSVKDPGGLAVAGASVFAVHEATGRQVQATTNEQGDFVISRSSSPAPMSCASTTPTSRMSSAMESRWIRAPTFPSVR